MPTLKIMTAAEQVARHLKQQIRSEVWTDTLPGGGKLANDLGVGRMTVEEALKILEQEGLLVPQGPGRRRKIHLDAEVTGRRILKIVIFSRGALGMEIQHRINAAGHLGVIPDRSESLYNHLEKMKKFAGKTDADAWIIVAGSKEVLQWFSTQGKPALALFGQRQGIPIAAVGPDKTKPLVEATRHLIELGHQRIVLLTREMRRSPAPGVPEQAFLDELANHNLLSRSYNLPEWEDTIEGFQQVLDSLFSITPPTAILTCLPNQFIAAILHLSLKGIKVPTDVSLLCLDDEEAMDWCRPSVAHIRWKSQPVYNRILRWVDNISQGKEDLRQTLTPAEYIKGGTIGPAKQ